MAARDHRATVFLVVGAIVVALLGVSALVERALNADLLENLGQARGQIQGVVAARRMVRNTQLALLERTFGSASDATRIRTMVDETLADLALVETSGATEPADVPLVKRYATEVHAWADLVRASIDAPLSGTRVTELRERLDSIDGIANTLIENSAASGAAVEQTTRALDQRRQLVALVEVLAIAATLWLAARWWSQRERLRAEVEASEAARLRLRQMAASIAHEINNQLGALHNTVELLRRKLPDDELIAFQRDSLDQLEKLTADFQEFSAPALRRTEQLDLVELARQVASSFGEQVSVVTPAGPVLVEADRARLSGALLNLVKNGLEASPPVELHISASGRGVLVRCTDQGPGIAAENAGQVGQPFFTTKARGTGLGIATVRQLAEAHGGRFDLENRPSGGAVAVLWLPSHPAHRGA